MANIQIPYANPLRFRKTTNAPDYNNTFPHPDNVEIGIKYQSGMYASKYVREHRTSKGISFQARLSEIIDKRISVYKRNNGAFSLIDTISANKINPVGWQGYDVYNYNYTPITNGEYYFKFNEQNYQSDIINVTDDSKLTKQLVNIQYYNTTNDYEMVFFDGDTNLYTGNIYLSGMLDIGEGKNEISSFEGDRGITEKLRGTPVDGDLLRIADIHWSYRKMIQRIFSCDYILINGVAYQNDEAVTFEKKEGSDLLDATVTIYETGINFY